MRVDKIQVNLFTFYITKYDFIKIFNDFQIELRFLNKPLIALISVQIIIIYIQLSDFINYLRSIHKMANFVRSNALKYKCVNNVNILLVR